MLPDGDSVCAGRPAADAIAGAFRLVAAIGVMCLGINDEEFWAVAGRWTLE